MLCALSLQCWTLRLSIFVCPYILDGTDSDLLWEENNSWFRHFSLISFTWVSWVFNHKFWLRFFIQQSLILMLFPATKITKVYKPALIWWTIWLFYSSIKNLELLYRKFMSLDNQKFIPRPSQIIGAVTLDDKVPEIIVFTDF